MGVARWFGAVGEVEIAIGLIDDSTVQAAEGAGRDGVGVAGEIFASVQVARGFVRVRLQGERRRGTESKHGNQYGDHCLCVASHKLSPCRLSPLPAASLGGLPVTRFPCWASLRRRAGHTGHVPE